MRHAVFARNKAGSAVNGFFRMHRFTVDEYHEMISAGILTKYHKVELLDSTLVFDRDEKGPLYAAERIPQFWLINLVDKCVECYSRPQGGREPAYRVIKTLSRDGDLTLVLDGKKYGALPVKQLLD